MNLSINHTKVIINHIQYFFPLYLRIKFSSIIFLCWEINIIVSQSQLYLWRLLSRNKFQKNLIILLSNLFRFYDSQFWAIKLIVNDYSFVFSSIVLAWPEVAAVAEAAAEEAVEVVARSAAVDWTCTFVLAEAAVAVAASPKVTALRITRQVLRQRGAGKRRRRRCTRQEPCWARGWLTLARPPPNRPSGKCHIKVSLICLT